MKKDLVKALGVTISSAEYIAASLSCGAQINTEYVSVPSLRAALEKLPVVQSCKGPLNVGSEVWSEIRNKSDTHTARLFAVEEIKRKPIKKEYFVDSDADQLCIPNEFKRRSLKITVEEIVGNGDGI